ncbi:MAG: hypothetical protein RLZZ136_33 [Pseudomonadota bacterium]
MALTIGPLRDDLAFGAKVTGLTAQDLQDDTMRQHLRDLWTDRGVILFRGSDSASLHRDLSQCFGPLENFPFKESTVDGHPDLVKIKYYPDNGSCYEVNGAMIGGWIPWHSDLIYTDTINRGGILRPVQLPRRGGQTGFADQIAAYDRLPEGLKQAIDGLHVVYVMDLNYANMKYARPKHIRFVRGAESFMKIVRRGYQYPRVIHPMVFTQPETGRKVLNVSPGFADGIYEIGGPEGDALLAEVIGYSVDPSQTYFHDWRADDMVLWDNWRTLHCAAGVPADETRVMQRTTISGDYALGRKLDGQGLDLVAIDV